MKFAIYTLICLYPIDPVFEAGGASNTWITECSDEKIIRMDLKIGVDTPYPTQEVWSSMRLVRKAPAPEKVATETGDSKPEAG